MSELTHITILGENELSREGLKRLILTSAIHASCSSFADAEEIPVGLDGYDHLILVEADGEPAAYAIAQVLRARFTHSKVALICNDFSLTLLKQGLTLGLNGFLTKDTSFSTLLRKLQLILAGQKVLPTQCIDDLVDAETFAMATDWTDVYGGYRLSEREVGILRCLADGDPNKVISRRLNIAEPTVKVHIKAILRKLRVENRTQAAVWAISQRSHPGLALH